MLNPIATASVTDYNKLYDEGRKREALGSSLFDFFSLWLGKKVGDEGTPETRAAKLSAASGGGGTATAYPKVMNDLEQSAKRVGTPQTIGDVHKLVKETLQSTESEFNLALQPIAGRKLVPMDIVNRIKAKINPAMLKTQDGQRFARMLNNIAIDYQKEWTLGELNQERMNATARLRAFHKAGPNAQAANLRTSARVAADEAIEDATKDIVYGALGPRYRALKMRQSALKTINEQLDAHTERLADAQAVHTATPMFGKEPLSGYAYPSVGKVGLRAHLRLKGAGPETISNRMVKSALPSTARKATRQVGRGAVLSLPVQHLKEPSRLPPPPPSDEDE
jgi:hypothetical protein